MKNILLLLFLLVSTVQLISQSREVPFTLDDRDRIMRTEEKLIALDSKLNVLDSKLDTSIGSLRSEMNAKFEAVDARFNSIDSKFETLYWAFGFVIALIMFLLGYIIWDRRTALNPVQDKTNSLENRLTKLEIVVKEQARKDPVFAELLRHTGIL